MVKLSPLFSASQGLANNRHPKGVLVTYTYILATVLLLWLATTLAIWSGCGLLRGWVALGSTNDWVVLQPDLDPFWEQNFPGKIIGQ